MDSRLEMFGLVKEYCRQQMPASPFSLWIKDITCEALTHDSATLMVKTDLRKMIIEARYLDLIENAFQEVLGFPVKLTLTSEEATAEPAAPEAPLLQDPKPGGAPGGEYEYTFDTFIVGSSNKFAHAAALAVASNPASAYNPLFIHGGSGLGKTHLLCAICDEIGKNHPDYTILYVKSEDFTNELITSLSQNKMQEFRDKYRPADVLLMDDIQFIGGKVATEEEFFHTFNTLYQSGKQIVLT
ncbi:MAG: DnaA/Hda family protein, partial [Oscillospiraceae bacterium]